MALISELLANIILLVTRPFSLLKLACLFGIRTALIVIYTWTELVKATISFHVNVIWGIITWTVELISLPTKLVNAFQRVRQLEKKVHQLQNELDNLIWDQKELQEQFRMAVKERKMLELVLAELEEEHDMAIVKIEKLEGKLRDLTNENLRLKEIQGKYWNSKEQNIPDNSQNIGDSSYTIPHSVLSWKSKYDGSGIALQDLLMPTDAWEDNGRSRTEMLKLLKTGPKSDLVPPRKLEMISKDVEMSSEVLDHRRDVALSQSLFSAIMSLVVGIIVWEAEDPCMPLVVALFTVVGMSLKSVVLFFSTIKNKPASDAVALLSFNWFILGTLTSPTLPRVARMLAPLLFSLVDKAMSQFVLLSFT